MAYKDSGEMPVNQSYTLGEYVLSIRVTQDPGEAETGINVRCDKGEERAVVSSEVTGTVESWRVEANDTTADVYVAYDSVAIIPCNAFEGTVLCTIRDRTYILTGPAAYNASTIVFGIYTNPYVLSDTPEGAKYRYGTVNLGPEGSVNYNGTVFYFTSLHGYDEGEAQQYPNTIEGKRQAALDILSSIAVFEKKTKLVARFAIDLHDAGGTGTDSDWQDPGDYDQDRDPSAPRTKLQLAITGATAGTHSGVPADKEQQQNYGSGGDGGNGGGGGAGASTVIVWRFTTDRADSKEITATTRGPGTGSSGGPGAKGGDGCILIFY